MSYGWLSERDDIIKDRDWFGVRMKADVPTRWEEFTFVRDVLKTLPTGTLLDAGCGFEPHVHVMPEIAANLGWTVTAIDLKSGIAPIAPHPLITRAKADMLDTGYDQIFDVVLSVSVIEHVSEEDRDRFFTEAYRVLKPGGTLIVTADGLWPRADTQFTFGEPVIPLHVLKNELGWPISFMVGTKP